MLEKFNNKITIGVIMVIVLLIWSYLLSQSEIFKDAVSSKTSNVSKNDLNGWVTEQGIEFEYRKKGEEVIKGKYCKLEKCKLSNKDLENFLKNKEVKELQIRGEEKIISEESLLRYNVFLSLENDKTKKEGAISKDNKLYKYDRDYKIIELLDLNNKEDVNNYVNLRNILEVCVNETYKDLNSCYKKSALIFTYSESWDKFAVDNKLEEQFNNIKTDETKKNEVLGKVNEKIKKFETKKTESWDAKLIGQNILDVLKNY